MESFVVSLLQNAPFAAGAWDGRWVGWVLLAPSSDTGNEEEVLLTSVYKAVNTNIAIAEEVDPLAEGIFML